MKISTRFCLTLAGLVALAATPAFAQRIATYDTDAAKARFSSYSFAYQDLAYHQKQLNQTLSELRAQVEPPPSVAKWVPVFFQYGIPVNDIGSWGYQGWQIRRARVLERIQEYLAAFTAKQQRVADPKSGDWPAQEYSYVVRRSIGDTGYEQVLDRNATPVETGYPDVTSQVLDGIGRYAGKGYSPCFTPDGYKAWTATKARYPGKLFPAMISECIDR